MFRHMYPRNVHSETAQKSGSGLDQKTVRIFIIWGLIALSIFLTIVSYKVGDNFGIGILVALVGMVLSIFLDIFLYNMFTRDRLNEKIEADSDNKLYRLFRIRLSDQDNEVLSHNVEPVYFTTGEVGVTIRIEIGNVSEETNEYTEEFLDMLFRSAHQLKLKLKIYTMKSEWRKSELYHNHLKRLSKVQDNKLRNTLAAIDAHQATIFEKGKVLSIHINLYTRRQNKKALNGIINLVESWVGENYYNSSIREIKWLHRDSVVAAICQFFGLKILDIRRTLTKKNVKYETRKLVRVYSTKRFNTDELRVETEAELFRKHKA